VKCETEHRHYLSDVLTLCRPSHCSIQRLETVVMRLSTIITVFTVMVYEILTVLTRFLEQRTITKVIDINK